jgi:uncharacterized protein (TIGR00269 family)
MNLPDSGHSGETPGRAGPDHRPADPTRCSRERCSARPVVDLPYAGEHLCRGHFITFTEERVRRQLHRQAPGLKGGTLAVALSGGKDSAVMLRLVTKYLAKRRGVKLVAVTIDEGISGYRSSTLEKARALTAELGVEHVVRSFREELGTTTDQAAATLAGTIPCSFCGVWRRTLLNRTAKELGAVRIAVGFNLDDLAQTVLLNLARGEPLKLLQMAPHTTTGEGLVPRIAPLAMVPEREVYLYARLVGVPFDHSECPHAGAAMRNVFREALWQMEEALPGTRHALLRTREKILEALREPPHIPAIGKCQVCGEPSSQETCRACELCKVFNAQSPGVRP